MRCFRFSVTLAARPVIGARAIVWVNERDPCIAESRARDLIRDLGWTVEAVRRSVTRSPDQMSRFSTVERNAYDRARQQGIFAYFR